MSDDDEEDTNKNTLKHLNSMEALADYASLVRELREEYDDAVAVIAFGGSYGGMLASWRSEEHTSELQSR